MRIGWPEVEELGGYIVGDGDEVVEVGMLFIAKPPPEPANV
jgi:hypothetical protein